jgi:hypothetical protein
MEPQFLSTLDWGDRAVRVWTDKTNIVIGACRGAPIGYDAEIIGGPTADEG